MAVEGIETHEQAEMLLWLGCELGQGWLYGRPVPAAQLAMVVSDYEQKRISNPSGDVIGRASLSSMDRLPSQRLAQLQAVYDGAPVGLAFLDRNLRYMNLNRRLANMNGRPLEEHLGRTVAEMIPELYPQVEPYIRRALAGEAISGFEITIPASGDSKEKTILLTYEPARDEAGEVVGVSVALVDLTPIKHAEQARRETEEHSPAHDGADAPNSMGHRPYDGKLLMSGQRSPEITGTTGEQWRGFVLPEKPQSNHRAAYAGRNATRPCQRPADRCSKNCSGDRARIPGSGCAPRAHAPRCGQNHHRLVWEPWKKWTRTNSRHRPFPQKTRSTPRL